MRMYSSLDPAKYTIPESLAVRRFTDTVCLCGAGTVDLLLREVASLLVAVVVRFLLDGAAAALAIS